MLKTIRRSARRACAFAGTKAAGAAVAMHHRPAAKTGDPTVHMLVSSRTWHAGLLAYVAFEQHTNRHWRFYIHEDGTVDDAARRIITKTLPDATLISREEADAKMRNSLEAFPLCLEQRSRHNLFLKFSDFVSFAPGERFIVLDSDVIFFRRPGEILSWVDSADDACLHNEDTKEKYCIPREEIRKTLGIAMWPRFNSGLVLMPRRAVDFQLAERFISAFKNSVHHPQFFEQTLYGLTATAWGRGGPLPSSYEISWGYFRKPGAICRHYVGEFKHDLLYIEAGAAMLRSTIKNAFSAQN